MAKGSKTHVVKAKSKFIVSDITDRIRKKYQDKGIVLYGTWEFDVESGMNSFYMRKKSIRSMDFNTMGKIPYIKVTPGSAGGVMVHAYVLNEKDDYEDKEILIPTASSTTKLNSLYNFIGTAFEYEIEDDQVQDTDVEAGVPVGTPLVGELENIECSDSKQGILEVENANVKVDSSCDSLEEVETMMPDIEEDPVMKLKSNVFLLKIKNRKNYTLSLRYGGLQAKEVLCCISEYILKKIEMSRNPGSGVVLSEDENDFIASHARNLYKFLKLQETGKYMMCLNGEERYKMAIALKECGVKFAISEYITYADMIISSSDRDEKIKKFIEKLGKELEAVNIKYSVSHSSKSSSMYLTLDDGRLGKVRVSDHDRSFEGVKDNILLFCGNYQYSESEFAGCIMRRYNCTDEREDYVIRRVVNSVVEDREEKIREAGTLLYTRGGHLLNV